MARKFTSAAAVLLVLVTQTDSQFFDFFNFPYTQNTNFFGNEYTTKRTTIKTNGNPQLTWKNNTAPLSHDVIEQDRHINREKKRKTTPSPFPTLAPIFNFYTSTVKPIRKTNKVTNRRNITNNNKESAKRKNQSNRHLLTSYDVIDGSKNDEIDNWYGRERPDNNKVADDYNYNKEYEITTKPFNYNDNNYVYNTYTTKNPFYTRPGVKPVVVDNRPPITNKPVTKRPQTQRPRPEYSPETYRPESYGPETRRPDIYRPQTQRPFRPETQRPEIYRPETQRPEIYRPETQRPNRPVTTKRPTNKPYAVNPYPTDAGAVVFPNDDEPPEIITGPDEDYMSDVEKRRHIEMAERMCDKYKSLNTVQVAAIPLLPSPEPVAVNVSQCAPTQIPLVVGGKVVTINEFPHMALLGWTKIDGGGYSWKCGGSLVSDRFVLTAAHCSYEERDNTVTTGPPRVVQLGSSYLDDPGALVVRVAAVVRHPKYKFPKSYYDVALLKLLQPVSFSEVIKPACIGLPPGVDMPIIATGWGKTEFGGDQSVELRSVSLPVWDISRCHEILGTSRKMPDGPRVDSQLCAGEKRGGKDTCQGDSGGPAQIQDGCVWRVVAVTSVGRSCGAPNTPGLYALVHRAFVAAVVFGDLKNTHRRSDNSQTNNNNNQNYNNNDNRQNAFSTQSNVINNRKTTTSTESYYNNHRTTITQPNYNQQQNDYHPQNHRTDSYNNQQNIYSDTHNQNVNVNTHSSNNPRLVDTNAFYNQQSVRNSNQDYNQPQNDYWNNNQPQNDYNRRIDGYESGRIWFT